MLLVSVVATVLLYVVPYGRYIAYPLMLLSTLAHELGHGLTAVLLGQHFDRFEMWSDGSGVAYWSGRQGEVGRLRLALVAAGGLVGPALVAAAAFACGRRGPWARWTLATAGVVLTFLLFWVVRSVFGAVFVVALILICFGISFKGREEWSQLVVVFFAVQLALSVFSRGDYLFTPVARTAEGNMPSDVGQMADALWLPYWFWGLVCGAFSVAVLVVALWAYWQDDGLTR